MDASTLRRLALLNLSTEQMSAVLELLADIDERDGARKAKTRERVRRCRERKKPLKRYRHVNVTLVKHYPFPLKERFPHTPLKKITPIPLFL